MTDGGIIVDHHKRKIGGCQTLESVHESPMREFYRYRSLKLRCCATYAITPQAMHDDIMSLIFEYVGAVTSRR